jgi:sugar O-acyltransferase (sialic acid O-acetyltransferase NeuD family)
MRADPTARPLLVFPCNGNAIEALDCVGPGHRLVGFVDDTVDLQGQMRYGHPVFSRSVFARWPEAQVLAVPGGPDSFGERRRIIESLGLDPDRFASVIHPSARVAGLARIGRNVLLMAGVVVTANAVIGDHVCVLPNSVIHHDARIGAWSLVGSNVTLAGHSIVGENCYVGSGSALKNGVVLATGTLVGLGSTVVRDTGAWSRVAGNPAHPLPARSSQ